MSGGRRGISCEALLREERQDGHTQHYSGAHEGVAHRLSPQEFSSQAKKVFWFLLFNIMYLFIEGEETCEQEGEGETLR